MRADGRTGYSRLKGREYTSGIAVFGEAMWYKLPKTADLTKLDDRWRTAIWLEKSDRSDEHIIGLENGAVLARSIRRKVEGKRWNERALKMDTGTPWNFRPGEVVARRYITRALVDVNTTPQMTRKWLQERIDDHNIQSDYKCTIGPKSTKVRIQ